jgi:hypothetical protein
MGGRGFKRRFRPPPHRFLIEAERVAVVDWGPSGLLHLRRADAPARVGCGRPAHGTSDFGEDPPERVFGHLAQTGLLCKGCLDAFERSLRVYAAP